MNTCLSSRLIRTFILCFALAFAVTVSLAQQRQRRVSPSAQQQGEANAEPAQQQAVEGSLQIRNARPKPAPIPAVLDRIAGELKIVEPQSHANLSIFLIEGKDRADTSKVLTLAEALARKGTVVVKETGNVNELTVENKDAEHTVFIMAGDIVKGGKQDRTLGTDLPLTTKSGLVPISAFCVEQGRWSARGGEEVSMFSASANAVATKDGKVAVRRAKAQGEVWQSVAKAQEKLSANVGNPVASKASPTSLQLTLENKELKKANQAFLTALGELAEKNPRSVGFVCVINGQINGAEIFAGHDLFRRAWPKLLESAATEAISEQKEKPALEPATLKTAEEFLVTAEDSKATKERIHGPFWSVTGESGTTLLFQTIDEAVDIQTADGSEGARWLRRSLIKK